MRRERFSRALVGLEGHYRDDDLGLTELENKFTEYIFKAGKSAGGSESGDLWPKSGFWHLAGKQRDMEILSTMKVLPNEIEKWMLKLVQTWSWKKAVKALWVDISVLDKVDSIKAEYDRVVKKELDIHFCVWQLHSLTLTLALARGLVLIVTLLRLWSFSWKKGCSVSWSCVWKITIRIWRDHLTRWNRKWNRLCKTFFSFFCLSYCLFPESSGAFSSLTRRILSVQGCQGQAWPCIKARFHKTLIHTDTKGSWALSLRNLSFKGLKADTTVSPSYQDRQRGRGGGNTPKTPFRGFVIACLNGQSLLNMWVDGKNANALSIWETPYAFAQLSRLESHFELAWSLLWHLCTVLTGAELQGCHGKWLT